MGEIFYTETAEITEEAWVAAGKQAKRNKLNEILTQLQEMREELTKLHSLASQLQQALAPDCTECGAKPTEPHEEDCMYRRTHHRCNPVIPRRHSPDKQE